MCEKEKGLDTKKVQLEGARAAEDTSMGDAGFSEELVKRISSVAGVAQLCPDVEPDEFLEDLAGFELPGAVQPSGLSVSKKPGGADAQEAASFGVHAAATISSSSSSTGTSKATSSSNVRNDIAAVSQVFIGGEAKGSVVVTPATTIGSSSNHGAPDKCQQTSAPKAAPCGILSLASSGTPFTLKANRAIAAGGMPPPDPIKAAVAGAKAAGGKGWDGVPLTDMPKLLKALAQPPSPPALPRDRAALVGVAAARCPGALGEEGVLEDQLSGMLVGAAAPGGLRRPQTNARFKRVLQQNTAAMAFLEGAKKTSPEK
jgi:hypothetical protein